MAQGLDLGKMASRPSEEAVEIAGEDTIRDFKSDEKKMEIGRASCRERVLTDV